MVLINKFNEISDGTVGTQPSGWTETGTVPPVLTIETAASKGIIAKKGSNIAQIAWGVNGSSVGIAFTLTGLKVGMKYRPGIWLFVPSVNGQDAGVLINSGPLGDNTLGRARDKWLWCEVEFTATSTSHVFAVWPSVPPAVANKVTYCDVSELMVTSRWEFPGLAESAVRSGQLSTIWDNLDTNLPSKQDNQPTMFPGYLSRRTTGNELGIQQNSNAYFTLSPVGVVVSRIADQLVSSGVNTLVSWDTVDSDLEGFWNAGSPTILTVPSWASGWYLVSWVIQAETGGSPNASYFVVIQKNGVEILRTNEVSTDGFAMTGVGSSMWWFNGGDTLSVIFRHISGVSKNIRSVQTGSGSGRNHVSMTLIGQPV